LGAPVQPFQIEPLTKAHGREGFSCGSEPLDQYLKQNARQDAEKRVAAPFVMIHPPANQVLGFYTLSAASINVSQIPQDLAKRLPRYPDMPVTLIGRLARDLSLKGQAAGEFLLMDALAKAFDTSRTIASWAVVVDAKDDNAEEFYQSFGFKVMQREPVRMFLPMATVAKLFS
jgi:predicted GNAT family N-acyltransferase